MTTGWLRGALRRLGLIGFGLLLALVLGEALLQAGAWYVRWRGEPPAVSWARGHRRVICVGDSNTYGLYLERSEAYPAQLQQRWDAEPRQPPVEILNLGVPGTNSSKLRSHFADLLRSFAPDVVVIMIGTNDAWTVPVPVQETAPSLGQRLWNHSRMFRLLYMLERAVANRHPDVAVEFVPPGQPHPKGVVRIGGEEIDLSYTAQKQAGADWPRALQANLLAMVEQARGAGAQPVLLTYPAEYQMYGVANQVIRAAARSSGAPLADVAAALHAACPQGGCPALFLPDYHATARGNAIVAETVEGELREVLKGAGHGEGG